MIWNLLFDGNKAMKRCDVAIVGGGPGGYVAALRAAQLGARTCVIEERELGGTCLNRGCIPTKSLLESARIYTEVQKGEQFGVSIQGASIDFAQAALRKNEVVGRLRGGVESLLKAAGVGVLAGRGSVLDAKVVAVSGSQEQEISASKIILASGSKPARPGFFPFDDDKVITSDEILQWIELPESLLIVGAGAVGVEFACIFAAFGVKVTLVEMMEQVLPGMDPDVARELYRALRRKRVVVHTGTKIERLEIRNQGIAAEVSQGETIEAEKALISVGRQPCSQDLGLEALDIVLERGFIEIDEHLRTNIDNIYAIGDVTGKNLQAHLASRQGEVAVENALGEEKVVNYDVVPACVFTEPEIGVVGLTEAQALERGVEVKVGKFPFTASGKAQVLGETAGFVKIVGDGKSGQILGVHIIGPRATDLIAIGVLAIELEATMESLAETVFAHPTISEAVKEAAEDWLGRAIHLPQRKG